LPQSGSILILLLKKAGLIIGVKGWINKFVPYQIVATGVCHTDATGLKGVGQGLIAGIFPTILGHEGSGIVESVGPGVTNVKPGGGS
jgi:Zn-dependent alcohol dehydrogenase